MNVQKGSKLNQLERALSEGLLVDASWLERRGYYPSQRSKYVTAGWLDQPARDLSDVHQLLENEGITDELRTAIIVYLISHDHSPHSLLDPVLRDISLDFEQNFVGMTTEDVTLDTLLEARENLISDVAGNMPDNHKEFYVQQERKVMHLLN